MPFACSVLIMCHDSEKKDFMGIHKSKAENENTHTIFTFRYVLLFFLFDSLSLLNSKYNVYSTMNKLNVLK